ncbi:MAG: carboxylating nicotinate-nucleotide diphosphorylase [Flavobacteriales bacterium]|nr:carboxylating nicotinate-nucleotide diphosphorylase [Flavobacteriales bacterium]
MPIQSKTLQLSDRFPLPDPERRGRLLKAALDEDIGQGDHTSLACLRKELTGEAQLVAKDEGVIAGVYLAREVFQLVDRSIEVIPHVNDGDSVRPGNTILHAKGPAASLLSAERVMLNFMQRLSGIATATRDMVQVLEGSGIKVLDTRKTTPGIRLLEKWAVTVGGGYNHRFGLDDMVLIKDNHIDFCGGVTEALNRVAVYLKENSLDLPVVIEARTMEEVEEVLAAENVYRILLDNFTPGQLKMATERIAGRITTEASGNIGPSNAHAYKDTGVDFISSGSLTHSVKCLDLSLKTVF